jgi:Glycosyl hydrolases family 43/Concanavalin A-like lectin/glucanases superfamily
MKYIVSMHRLSQFVPRQLGLTFLAVCIIPGFLQAAPSNLRGSLGIHDPSTIIQCNGRYYIFGTHGGIYSKSSADKQYWFTGPSVFPTAPSWTTSYTLTSGLDGFWAPDVIYFNGQYHLYYSISTFGSQVSAIGLATNPTLDPNAFSYHWTDQGPVIQSITGNSYNCIDPSVTFDASSNLWMSFGSYWNGIYLVQLDAATGLRNATNSTLTRLAFNSAQYDPIEASYLYHHGSYYYLFVNWGACCAGMNSTYNIRVGRSTTVTGPYLDRNNVNMVSSGGTLFLKTTGKYIGPGQIGILDEDGTNCFSYHYYDGNANGTPTLDIEPLYWTPDGWPAFTNDWAAVYRFQFDARDDNNQYYGLLQNGAYVHYDPLLGDVLVLNGTNQFVNLPDGAANGCTVSAVFNWNGGADWQHIFDFGRATNKYAFLTPRNGSTGKIRFAITASSTAGEQVLDGTGAAPVGAWTQVAVTTDGSRGILYVNGVPVTTNTSMTLTLPDIAPTSAWFGRSQYTNNPYFNGEIGSIHIYGRALSANEIVAPQSLITAPTTGTHYQPGGTVQFAGAATEYADTPLSVTGLTWTVEFHDTGVTNVVLGPLNGVGGGSFTIPSDGGESTNGFHRVVLAATDTLGRMATNFVDVFPGPANSDWTAFYPFNTNAADVYGLFNGTLQNSATTPTDFIRGPVLNLNGASQYVSLPAGVGALRTFAAWVKWGGGNAWQRIFDFGSGTTSYAMLTTKANNGALRFWITPNGSGEVRNLDAPNPLPINVWTHVAVTLDGRQAVMFVNGQAVAVNASVNLLPSDVAGTANYLGRSRFTADPYFSGQMDSVQIASLSLPIEQITASSIGLSHTASTLTLNWPSWTNGLVLGSVTNLGSGAVWTPVANPPLATNGINFLTLAPTNNQMFFRLQLP